MPRKKPAETAKPDAAPEVPPKPKPLKALFSQERVFLEQSDGALDLFNQGRYGEPLDDGKIQLALHEALYLFEKQKIFILAGKKKLGFSQIVERSQKLEPNFWTRYCVYKDIRNRGYIIKTALKFGADFRVYDRGVKPGEDHARWVVYPVQESNVVTWYEFSAKNRVAHSTKKRLLIGIVDDENDVTYYEIRWMRP